MSAVCAGHALILYASCPYMTCTYEAKSTCGKESELSELGLRSCGSKTWKIPGFAAGSLLLQLGDLPGQRQHICVATLDLVPQNLPGRVTRPSTCKKRWPRRDGLLLCHIC